MDGSNTRSLRPLLDTTRRRVPFSEVLTLKTSSMQRLIQMMHRAVQNSCITALKLMCLPLESLRCDKIQCSPAQLQKPLEEGKAPVVLQTPPPTILIINSTLINCVIGSQASLSAVADRQPLMQHSRHCTHGTSSCGCEEAGKEPPPSPPSSEEQHGISIHGSHLNYVIVGDNNYMHAELSTSLD